MDSSKSKEKKQGSRGQVNTDDTVNVHNQEFLIILYIICIARRYEFLKKRYTSPTIF